MSTPDDLPQANPSAPPESTPTGTLPPRANAPRSQRRRLTLALIAAGLLAGSAEGLHRFAADDLPQRTWRLPADGERDAVPYNRAVETSSHNSYAHKEPIFDQLVWHGVRSLELDIHTKKAGEAAPAGDWFVYHADLPFFRASSCTTLSDCLGQLKAFHDAVPDHDVVTLWVDLKDDFQPGKGPEDLDRLLEARLGREVVVRPEDLVARCPGARSLREAVTGKDASCTFPLMGELRGKFVVAVTGGSSCDDESPVRAYAGTAPLTRAAFVAPDVDGSCTVESYASRSDVVFLNMPLGERRHAREVAAQGLVSRIYGGALFGSLDTQGDLALAEGSGSVHLATDLVHTMQSALASTLDGTRKALSLGRAAEHAAMSQLAFPKRAAIEAIGAGIGGTSDSFWFAYDHDPTDASYRTFASVPSASEGEGPNAKACLMARESDEPDAANVAVCRSFAGMPLSLQVRPHKGAETTASPWTDVVGVSVATPAFMRLDVRANGEGTDVVAEGSTDGVSWKTMARVTVGVPLPLRGVAVASDGASPVRAIVGELVRHAGDDAWKRPWTALQKAIGTGARGRVSARQSGEST